MRSDVRSDAQSFSPAKLVVTRFASRSKCHASSNRCLTSSNKKLLI